jgi:hypothetical protein
MYFGRMKSKWASCSPRGNLTVNTLLKFLPADLIEYVVYHEIAHLIEKRHDQRFWKMIKRRFKDYREKERPPGLLVPNSAIFLKIKFP